ncbi:hypothetical protein DRN74_00035 [Candidatus Micrarchaeota archaeon]|nr:MAG: hypothetical protein DRN74_00035 [Candidatus Micrarchaeota archaeon]
MGRKMKAPIFSKPYRILAYKICKKLGIFSIPFLSRQMKKIKPLLLSAKLRMTEEEYFGTIIFTTMLLFPFESIIFYLLLITVPAFSFLSALFLSLIFASFMSVVIFAVFLIYPTYRVEQIKRDIEANVPYAAMHMATIAGTGVPTYKIFEMMGKFKEYGEVSDECKRISRDINFFGYDMLTTMSKTATNTPSPSFKDLLWGLVAVIRSGGDTRHFLMEKARQYLERQKNIEKEYLDSLSVMAELYITLFVAGPILFVIMVTIMGSMTNLGLPVTVILSVLIYFILPIASIAYIIMLEGSKPVGFE